MPKRLGRNEWTSRFRILDWQGNGTVADWWKKRTTEGRKEDGGTLKVMYGRFTVFQLIKMQICTSSHGLILHAGGSAHN